MSGYGMGGWVSAVAERQTERERAGRLYITSLHGAVQQARRRVGGQATRTFRCNVVQACKHACVGVVDCPGGVARVAGTVSEKGRAK
jgi:succinate dehydrogenase/fumarate reductase-like Fe-S protein